VNPRYAVYFVPAAQSALYRFGASVLGYDCYTGSDVGFPTPLHTEQSAWREVTAEPRRYGFHATLKAPFHLSEGADEAALVEEFHVFCRSTAVAAAFTPTLAVLEGFVAIVPAAPEPTVDRLAAACVTAFDRFRAPPGAQDRASRVAAGLSERQVRNLDRWGYPYVFEEFRLHLTLTGRLGADRQASVLSFLRDGFAAADGAGPLPIDRIALLRQDRRDCRFTVIRHAAIGAVRQHAAS
jgi:putative phosphonate metabolism protein